MEIITIMKKNLIIFCILFSSTDIFSQKYSLKGGVNINWTLGNSNDKMSEQSHHPSYEIDIERTLGKKFSINADFLYSKQYLYNNNENPANGPIYGTDRWTDIELSLIPEGRYYAKTTTKGFFFEVGIPITYTIEKHVTNYHDQKGNPIIYNDEYSFSISTIGGIGFKYPFNKNFGGEVNVQAGPNWNFLNPGETGGIIKGGLKLIWFLDSKK